MTKAVPPEVLAIREAFAEFEVFGDASGARSTYRR